MTLLNWAEMRRTMTGIALMQKGEPMSDLIDRQAAIDANTRAVERSSE